MMTESERKFWMEIRRAFLIVAQAIEARCKS